MINLLNRLAIALVACVVAVHVWMSVRYGSSDPCTAVVSKLIRESKPGLDRFFIGVLAPELERIARSRGAVWCYQQVLFGSSTGEIERPASSDGPSGR